MNNDTEIKLLCIGTTKWCNKYIKTLQSDYYTYNIEISNKSLDLIQFRLQHNSYDILIIDYNFIKKLVNPVDFFEFNKLSFAMARPSILVCSSIFQYLYLKFLLVHTKWLIKFNSAKDFVHLTKVADLQNCLNIINNSKIYHSQITKISKEIYNVFINE